MKTKIIPAILAKDFSELKEKINLTENDFDLLQIDAIDGKFVNNRTFYDIDKLQGLETKPKFELHLMVNDPLEIINNITSEKITRVIFHLEPVKDKVNELIFKVKDKGLEAGIALNPETSLEEVEPYLNQVNVILLMTVNPGWSGQGFLESSYNKIKELRALDPEIEIEVDGGVSQKNIPLLIQAGVNSIAIGSSLFNSKNITATINSLKSLIIE